MTQVVLGTNDAGDVALNIEQLVESRMLIQAQSGGGKTSTLRRMLEQSHGHVQQLVIDPEGEFYTLRERYDYIIAGKGGDCAADPRSAKLLAKRLLELGVSAVCDLSELKSHDRIRFVRLFLEALIEAPRSLRHPVLVVIDEAHLFCPEKGQAESAAAVIDLCTRGRKRGLCAILATQRLSKLHKDAAAELRNVMVGATGLDIDQQRAGDVLGFSKADRLALRDLAWREFYAYGPAISPGVIRLTVGDTQTKNPQTGAALASPPPPTAKVRAMLAKIADLPAEAEAEARDNETLRRDLADVRRKLTNTEKMMADAVQREIVPAPCDHEGEIASLKSERDSLHADATDAATQLVVARRELHSIAATLRAFPARALAERIDDFLIKPDTFVARAVPKAVAKTALNNSGHNSQPVHPPRTNGHASTPSLSASQQAAILRAVIAVFPEGIGKNELAESIGVSPTSGGYFNNLGRLRSLGAVDYPSPGRVAATAMLFPEGVR